MNPSPQCEIYATRYGSGQVVILAPDWIDSAEIDTTGLVASILVPIRLMNFDAATELSHAMIGNIRYEITKREIVPSGWKLWLHSHA